MLLEEILESMNISAEYYVTCPDICLSDVVIEAAVVSFLQWSRTMLIVSIKPRMFSRPQEFS